MKVPLAFALIFPLALTQACTRQPAATLRAEAAPLTGACRVAAASNTGSDADITKLQQDLRDGRASSRAAELLGYRFVARARVSNDAGFYTLAEQAAACLESIQPGDPAALLLRGHVLHQLHRFGEAEVIARRLVTLREFVLDYGLLGDVLMEQGRLNEAAVAYQKMVDLKPFYQSYIRAAHLRWLKGDLDGAIALMHSAIRAVSPRDPESVAWAYSRLAVYELQRGQLAEASRMNDASLQHVPDYAAALLTRGRIQLAEKKYATPPQPLCRKRRPSIRCPNTDGRWLTRCDRSTATTKPRGSNSNSWRRVQKIRGPSRSFCRRAAKIGVRAVALARQELEKRARRLHAGRPCLGTGLGRRNRRSILAHDARAGGGHAGRAALPPRRSNRRRRRPPRRRQALGEPGPGPSLHPASVGAWGTANRNRGITPKKRLEQ